MRSVVHHARLHAERRSIWVTACCLRACPDGEQVRLREEAIASLSEQVLKSVQTERAIREDARRVTRCASSAVAVGVSRAPQTHQDWDSILPCAILMCVSATSCCICHEGVLAA